MKTSAVFLAMGAALTRAQAPGDVPINCAQANANYCMEDGSDIILRCDENAIGVPARCSPNLSGYPPSGGFATCWQSSEEAGDAACEKNCVVYAEPPRAAFTLAGDECTPSHTDSETTPGPSHPPPNSTITTTITIPTTHCEHECTETHTTPSPPLSPPPATWPTVIPTTNGTWSPPTETHPPPPPPETTDDVPPPPETTGDAPPPPPPPGTTGGGDEPTNVPVPSTTTGGIVPVPTSAATAKRAGVLLVVAGLTVAFLL